MRIGDGRGMTGVLIVAASEDSPPFQVDAIIIEDDTHHILSADPNPAARFEPLDLLLSEAIQTEPDVPGTVIARSGEPLELVAVVHDLDQEPSCRAEWIAAALRHALEEVEQRELRSMALPVLGHRLGSLAPTVFLESFARALSDRQFQSLKRVWLAVPVNPDQALRGALTDYGVQFPRHHFE